MSRSVYLWSLRPEVGLAIELRILAENACSARREVRRFLAEHDGVSWDVECVTRETIRPPHVLVTPVGHRRQQNGVTQDG